MFIPSQSFTLKRIRSVSSFEFSVDILFISLKHSYLLKFVPLKVNAFQSCKLQCLADFWCEYSITQLHNILRLAILSISDYPPSKTPLLKLTLRKVCLRLYKWFPAFAFLQSIKTQQECCAVFAEKKERRERGKEKERK